MGYAFNKSNKQKRAAKKIVAVNHGPSVKSILHPNLPSSKLNQTTGKVTRASNRTGMPGRLKTGLEVLSGMDLSGIRVHRNSSEPAKFGALAYTSGKDIHLGPRQEKYLPHEGWHLVQQMQGRVKPKQSANKNVINDDKFLEQEADYMGSRALQTRQLNQTTANAGIKNCGATAKNLLSVKQRPSNKAIQFVRPSYVISHVFLGINIPVDRGVHPDMRDALVLVEAELQRQYDALDSATRPASLQEYAGIDSIKGWRETTTQHGTGSAVDVNYRKQPYIATRTTEGNQTSYGGERPPTQNTTAATRAALRALRRPAVEVYDRAVSFMRTNPYNDTTADVGNRRVGETATDVYQRFRTTSDTLSDYLSLVFLQNQAEITRQPVADPETASESDLTSGIPDTERKDEATAVTDIQAIMDDPFWAILHPNHMSAREQYIRILRDYEIVRRPMQYGNPVLNATHTRNPALGFLHMPEHFVVAMMDIGDLRWGASEFGVNSNGDIHHFDLRDPYHSPVPEPETDTTSETSTETTEDNEPAEPASDEPENELTPLTFNVQTNNLIPKRWSNRTNVNAGDASTRTNITLGGPPGSTIDITRVRQDAPNYGHTHTNAASSARERQFKHGHNTNQADGMGQEHSDFQINAQGSDRTITYHAPHVAGDILLTAQIRGRNDTVAQSQETITIEVTGLREYTTNHPNEVLVGQTINHGSNHWGTENAITTMERIVTDFRAAWVAAAPAGTIRNPDDAPTIRINDFSLEHGGVYDFNDNWRNPHQTHRFGEDIDISRRVLINGVATHLRPGNDDIGALYNILNAVIGVDPEDNAHWHVDV